MKKTQIYGYYAFGHNYQLIKADGLKGSSNSSATNDLNAFINELDFLVLPVTSMIAENLKGIIRKIPANDEDLSLDVSSSITEEMEKIDPALDAELQLKDAFILTEKRFSLKSLTESPKSLLAHGVFEKLSDSTKKDFTSACMQIALSQPTGAAFHLMRALEAEVKHLYFEYKKQNRLERPMWAAMIQQLRAKRNPKPEVKTLDLLDSVRIHFRNPTQHPEAFYSLDESQDLMNQTITAINMIQREIARKNS